MLSTYNWNGYMYSLDRELSRKCSCQMFVPLFVWHNRKNPCVEYMLYHEICIAPMQCAQLWQNINLMLYVETMAYLYTSRCTFSKKGAAQIQPYSHAPFSPSKHSRNYYPISSGYYVTVRENVCVDDMELFSNVCAYFECHCVCGLLRLVVTL